MSEHRWPPPDYPLVEGRSQITRRWSIELPETFARRVEEDELVLWRPGLTFWLSAWGNDLGQTREARLAALKQEASPDRHDESWTDRDGITRYSYRLLDEIGDGPVESLHVLIFSDEGHLQIAAYFDEPGDLEAARAIIATVEKHDPA